MARLNPSLLILVYLSAVSLVFSDELKLPKAAEHVIDFEKEIVPILSTHCSRCHVGEDARGGFDIISRESFMTGGNSGAAVAEGKSSESYLIELIAGVDEDLIMPAQGQRLADDQIGILRAWIDQGLKWNESFHFAGPRDADLSPRLPTIPSDAHLTNPIDLILTKHYKRSRTIPEKLVSDRLFARRVHLDLIGMLPTPEHLVEFERDTHKNKRELLVAELLSNHKAYAEHWLTFWNDALRNAYRGTGYIDGGRKSITDWLYTSLYDNKPYNQFVHELISPVPGSEGFTAGIIWRGVVNASQRREMQAAQNISQVFMGTNLKCASCHDSFVNHWKLADAYGLAAVFADGPLEVHRCNKPIGETAKAGFLYPQLGSIDGSASKQERQKQLADILTSSKNGRLSRTIVNRLWASMMGRGIIEPLDDLDQPAWNQDLLDWLANDLQQHNYDLKRTLILICTSRAYQLAAAGAPRPDETAFVFRGPIVKRMSAEQFVDAVAVLTGRSHSQPAIKLPLVDAPNKSANRINIDAKWIWSHAAASSADPGGRIFLRKTFELTERPQVAAAVATCDNEFELFVNGKKVAVGNTWSTPVSADLTRVLVKGINTIAVQAINYPDPTTKKGLEIQGANPAGFIFAAGLQWSDKQWTSLLSDESWIWTKDLAKNWHQEEFETKGWKHAVALGEIHAKPWDLEGPLKQSLAQRLNQPTGVIVRTSLANDDTLTRALGRPNREQVVTRRDSLATTLQAIELTNGETLDKMLKQGASNWMSKKFNSKTELLDQLYLTGLGRPPTPGEVQAAIELFEDGVTEDALEDLLWILTMLPEFQLIY